jgi:hypothetical protein
VNGYERWQASTRLAMARRGIDPDTAEAALEPVAARWAATGQDPQAAVGSPEAFAAAVDAARPPTVRAGRNRNGPTPMDTLTGGIFAMAVLSVVPTLMWAWYARDLAPPLTVAGLVGTALLATACLLLYAVYGAMRAGGHPRLAVGCVVLGVAFSVLAAVAFTQLPRTGIAEVPILAVLVVAALVMWATTRAPRAR